MIPAKNPLSWIQTNPTSNKITFAAAVLCGYCNEDVEICLNAYCKNVGILHL